MPINILCFILKVMASESQRVTKGKGSATESVKAIWDRQTTSTFIQLCVEQVRSGNMPHTHFNKIGWERIIKRVYGENWEDLYEIIILKKMG